MKVEGRIKSDPVVELRLTMTVEEALFWRDLVGQEMCYYDASKIAVREIKNHNILQNFYEGLNITLINGGLV